MNLLINLALAAVPGLVWLWIFYRKDRYEPEPKRLVLLAAILGALLVPLIHRMAPFLPRFAHLPEDLTTLVLRSLIVALSEEIPKALLLILVFYPLEEFDEPMDGIVYGASIGIGFSTLENALYMREFGQHILLFRMFMSTGLHVVCCSLIGYALGQWRFRNRGPRFVCLVGLSSILIHAGFDALISLADLRPELSWLAPLSLVGLLALVVASFQVLDQGVEEALRLSPFRPSDRAPMPLAGPRDGSSDTPDEPSSTDRGP